MRPLDPLQISNDALRSCGIYPRLVLCADGGGSKVKVVVRSEDGLEVQATAGPCNVLSVGPENAIQRIMLATYRAMGQLPESHRRPGLYVPPTALKKCHEAPVDSKAFDSEHVNSANGTSSKPGSSVEPPVPVLAMPCFDYVWLAMAGVSTPADVKAFLPYATRFFKVGEERMKLTIDVDVLTAPALALPDIRHVVAVVCGTGTVGRTIGIGNSVSHGSLLMEDLAVARGWGFTLCDEGSAYWLGRLAIRSVLKSADRIASARIYSEAPSPLLPLHLDLLEYFGVADPMDLLNVASLTGTFVENLSVGEATSKRNAFMAGAARIVLSYAFPEDAPHSIRCYRTTATGASHQEALDIVTSSINSLLDMTLDLLGDGTVVDPRHSALVLGGGLWQSERFRALFEEGLRERSLSFRASMVVSDAAAAGVRALANLVFGQE